MPFDQATYDRLVTMMDQNGQDAYGHALAGPKSPLGSPPPVKTLPPIPMPPPQATPQPSPGPTPAPPGLSVPPPTAEMVAANEAQHRKAYEDHLDNFLRLAANDYTAGKLNRDDLKKAASYSGTQKYPEWRHENVEHLKAIAKARE